MAGENYRPSTARSTGALAISSRRWFLAREDGVVAIITALLLVVLLALVALVIDLGGLYDHDRELQTAADAGALAGCQELAYSPGAHAAAGDKAVEYVNKNTSPNSGVDAGSLASWSPVVTDRSVTVDLVEEHVPFFFAPLIGQAEGSVTAHAKAEIMYVTGTRVFPVAINYMNPAKFRFRFRPLTGGGSEFFFDLTDPDNDGIFDQGGTTEGGLPPGTYTVDLEALESDGSTVGMTLPDMGFYRVADSTDENEKLYRVGMSQAIDSSTITIRAEAAPTAFDPETPPESIEANLGGNKFDLAYSGTTTSGTHIFEGSGPVPAKTTNDGWQAHDLTIKELTGNKTVGRYTALHPDVPLKYIGLRESFFDGYSAVAGEDVTLGGVVKTRVLKFGDKYVMKLGNQAGSGLYSGNWRIADVYKEPNTAGEIGTFPTPDDWTLYHDLKIGGPLEPDGGAKVGQIKNGLADRFAGYTPNYSTEYLTGLADDAAVGVIPEDDPYFVIIPIVEFTALNGTSEPYTISGFSGFYITDYSSAGDIEGVFVHSFASGEWTDVQPPGDLYVETVVMTE